MPSDLDSDITSARNNTITASVVDTALTADGVYDATFSTGGGTGIAPAGFNFVEILGLRRIYTGPVMVINGIGFLNLNHYGISTQVQFDLSLHISSDLRSLRAACIYC